MTNDDRIPGKVSDIAARQSSAEKAYGWQQQQNARLRAEFLIAYGGLRNALPLPSSMRLLAIDLEEITVWLSPDNGAGWQMAL
jgi:hypothetical protein